MQRKIYQQRMLFGGRDVFGVLVIWKLRGFVLQRGILSGQRQLHRVPDCCGRDDCEQ
jgi:hypothetical protein